MTIISKSCFRQKHLLNEVADIAQFDLVNSRTCGIKFKDFQAPVLFSSTFKALHLGEKKFKHFQGCVGTLNCKEIYLVEMRSFPWAAAADDRRCITTAQVVCGVFIS